MVVPGDRKVGVAILVVAVAAGSFLTRCGGPRSDGQGERPPSVAYSPAPPATGDRGGVRATGATDCERWVSPAGDDGAAGSMHDPWASLEHAVEAVPGVGCTVWFEDGIYRGSNEVERRFRERTVFRAVNDYQAILQSSKIVLDIGRAASLMTFRGFQIRQPVGGADVAIYVSGSDGGQPAPSRITFMDNIIHDSYDEDLMKIRSRASAITVQGNVFYNQGSNEQHIDVNSVTNVVIQGNVFFNAFGASERPFDGTTKHYIVVKDSNQGTDGLRGSARIAIRSNVFLNWQGDVASFIGIGNDGEAYHEAKHVQIVNNLLVGNSPLRVNAALTVYGARYVAFTNNTVVGTLPSEAYAFDVDRKGRNPRNLWILFRNNIWSDPSGTMNRFSDGRRINTIELVLRRNLYWNGGRPIPRGDLLSPSTHDPGRVVRNPLFPDPGAIVLPVWEGSAFRSGLHTIRDEFLRLVAAFGEITPESPAVGRALTAVAPPTDILGRPRDEAPDLGAFEASP